MVEEMVTGRVGVPGEGVREDERNLMYVANLGRYTVVRVRLDGVRGQLLASHARGR